MSESDSRPSPADVSGRRRALRPCRSAFTLLELLVVIGIIALLIAILLPSLSMARAEGMKAKCLGHLHGLGQAFAAYTSDDEGGYTSPVHPKAETSWIWEGDYEYGGMTGKMAWGSNDFKAENRLLNKFIFGSGSKYPFEWYQCPGDEGIPKAPVDHEPAFFDPAVSGLKTYEITGTSFRLNHLIDFLRISPYDGHFYGPYLRPRSRVPNTGMTVLLSEAIMEVAKWNESTYRTVGWHRKANIFNAMFVDGHAGAIHVLGEGNPLATSGNPDYWIWRGDGWRMDCFPERPIPDLP